MTRFGILASGNVGQTLAKGLIAHGYDAGLQGELLAACVPADATVIR